MFQGTGACMGRRKYVLIVDDCQQDRMAVADVLRSDYDILEACNGKQALEILSRKRAQISLIMLDLMMPVMGGLEAAQQIRAMELPEAKQVPIIPMTAQSSEESKEGCRAAGMNSHLTKPIEPDSLVQTILETAEHAFGK